MSSNTLQTGLNVGDTFRSFCKNILIPSSTNDDIRYRYKRITKQLNKDFWNYDSDTLHSLYVGSYGRDTDIIVSDIDILFWLPYNEYLRYNRYVGNSQSALLQDVKKSIQKTYPETHLRADGQVIIVHFTDGVRFEIVPCFERTDSSFSYPDTNNGGSWKKTDPRPEIKAVKTRNDATNGNMKHLCRMARAWKKEWSVPMGGLHIDTLAYNFLGTWEHKGKSEIYYDWMSRDFFKYLSEQNTDQEFWYALGSYQKVYRKGAFEYKAKQCYKIALEAIEKQDYPYTAKSKWREIYGTKFPA